MIRWINETRWVNRTSEGLERIHSVLWNHKKRTNEDHPLSKYFYTDKNYGEISIR